MKNIKFSGTLLFLAGSFILMGIITAEAFIHRVTQLLIVK